MTQEDGGKKIELKPGFLMEHDKDVKFFLSCFLFLHSGLLYLGLLQIEAWGAYVLCMLSVCTYFYISFSKSFIMVKKFLIF